MDNLESAVLAALDPCTAEPTKSLAMQYCEQVRCSNEGWQTCLELFLKAQRCVTVLVVVVTLLFLARNARPKITHLPVQHKFDSFVYK